jgi:hypothetical protein
LGHIRSLPQRLGMSIKSGSGVCCCWFYYYFDVNHAFFSLVGKKLERKKREKIARKREKKTFFAQ